MRRASELKAPWQEILSACLGSLTNRWSTRRCWVYRDHRWWSGGSCHPGPFPQAPKRGARGTAAWRRDPSPGSLRRRRPPIGKLDLAFMSATPPQDPASCLLRAEHHAQLPVVAWPGQGCAPGQRCPGRSGSLRPDIMSGRVEVQVAQDGASRPRHLDTQSDRDLGRCASGPVLSSAECPI